MTVPVLLAATDPRWESAVVASLAGGSGPLTVARRCVDVADLLAAAAAGIGRVAVVSADLRQLDRDVLARLAAAAVPVVGVVQPQDEAAERRLRQWGVTQVVTSAAATDAVTAAALAALAEPAVAHRRDWSEPRRPPDAGRPGPPAPGSPASPGADDITEPAGSGQPDRPVIAVWGPAGAPGRSTVAINLAAELAQLTGSALLVDADVYAASHAQLLGLLDEAPGIAAACRLANAGRLDVPTLAEVALAIRGGLRVLTGIPRADRWPELRPTAIGAVLKAARRLAGATVVDVSFCLEQDEELSFDTAAPRRNGATLAVLDAADVVLAVAAADPIGLQRYVRAVAELRETVPGAAVVPVVNRVRRSAVPSGDPEVEVTAALERYAGLRRPWLLPDDPAACDAAVASGRTLAEAAPNSPLRAALAELAAELAAQHAGVQRAPARSSRRRLRRRRRAPRYAGR